MPVRISVVGLGTVGTWLLRAIARHHDRLVQRYDVDLRMVALANRRDGFVYREAGIDVAALAIQLQRDGAQAFVKSWEALLERVADKSATLVRA